MNPPAPPLLLRNDGVKLDLIEDVAGFLALRRDWEALFARAASPQQLFQSHAFLRHWTTHYLEAGARLGIVVAWRGGELAMAWPLVRRRRYGLDTLRFMGGPVGQFSDVLADHDADELLRAGWSLIRQQGADLFETRKLRDDSQLVRSGLLAGALRGDLQLSPFVDLTRRVGESGPSAAYTARERSSHRRRLRRLGERGRIAFRALPAGAEAAALAGGAIAMKRAMLARHGIVAPVVNDARFAAFFADLARDGSGEIALYLSAVTCDDAPIGIDLSFDCKGQSFGHVLAVDPDHERGGVGKILIHHSFACARARGSAIFDQLAPAEPYKLEHADGSVAVSDHLLPLSLKGRLACGLGLQHWRPALKTMARRLPPGIVRYATQILQARPARDGAP